VRGDLGRWSIGVFEEQPTLSYTDLVIPNFRTLTVRLNLNDISHGALGRIYSMCL